LDCEVDIEWNLDELLKYLKFSGICWYGTTGLKAILVKLRIVLQVKANFGIGWNQLWSVVTQISSLFVKISTEGTLIADSFMFVI
jgi:hypothetical protein